ncbi:MAG: hypothetical protein R3E79_28725 [Caldilineaceae bacterium]
MPKVPHFGVRRLLVLLVCLNLLNFGAVPLAPGAVTVTQAAAPAPVSNQDTTFGATSTGAGVSFSGATKPAPPALAAFAPFPGPAPAALTLFAPTTQVNSAVIRITATGFNPPTLPLFGPTDVTWINDTTTTHTLRSGTPIIDSARRPRSFCRWWPKGRRRRSLRP